MDKYFKQEQKEKHENGCWNCLNYNWTYEACCAFWNNLDESYYNPDTDGRELTDICEYHEIDKDADYEDIFGEDK